MLPKQLSDAIFTTLSDTQESAAVALFFSLLRNTPGLRQWLRIVYSDPDALDNVQGYVSGKLKPPPHRTGHSLLAWLASPDLEILDEIDRNEHTENKHARRYGGLTRSQVILYIRKYQAGKIDIAAFLTATAWRQVLPNHTPANILKIGELFLRSSITEDRPHLIRQLARAADFFHEKPVGTLTREKYGYANWWKLVLLHYILNNPKPKYCTREFRQYLMSQKLPVEEKDIRRFCLQHGIDRDKRPGRPKSTAGNTLGSSRIKS
ncbi:MAG: hypothetical protein LBV12_11120 [Puniceicoccales bacterium]|jgi:hypothetical protein|nr:hypothetical protein [Puniceicoccales bacterium]